MKQINFIIMIIWYTRRMEHLASNLSIFWLWQIQLCWLEIQLWGGSMLARQPHQLWFCITDVRLPHMWLTLRLLHNCEVTSIVVRLPHHLWGCLTNHDAASPVLTLLHTCEATSPFVRLTHKCKATSHVRQPHLFWCFFPPPKVILSVVRLHHSGKAASPIVRLF